MKKLSEFAIAQWRMGFWHFLRFYSRIEIFNTNALDRFLNLIKVNKPIGVVFDYWEKILDSSGAAIKAIFLIVPALLIITPFVIPFFIFKAFIAFPALCYKMRKQNK